MKKLILALSIFLCSIFGSMSVNAQDNNINSMNITVYIDKNGNAHICETWNMYVDEGSEVYKVMENMGDSKITNLKVIDENNTVYTNIGEWDVDASKEDKKEKCGIVNDGDYYEICFGIGDYGNRVYTFEYDVSHFIRQYNDYQGCNFAFFSEMSLEVDEAYVTISSYFDLDEDSIFVDTFGYEGYYAFDNGNLIMQSEDTIYEDGGMQLVLEFQEDCFENLVCVDENLDDVLENMYSEEDIPGYVIAGIGGVIAAIIAIVLTALGYTSKKKELETFVFSDHSLLTDENIVPSKDISIKDIYEFYYLAKKLNLIEDDSGLLEAIIIRCLNDQAIQKDKKKLSIDLTQMQVNNQLDKELLMYLKQASKDQSILKEKAFIKYCENHYYNFTDWYNHVENYMCNQYKNMGKLTYEEISGKFLFFNIKTKREVFDISVKTDMIQILALNKYLETCSEKELLKIDDSYYLILRSVLGLNDHLDDSYDDSYYYVYHIHGFVHKGIEAHDSINSTSSLSGGSFSGGGGGGTR
ncbi:MAG: DUF2207 domain-containing protein [Erysipelotrichaceae bacterium]|nr:DUF2207 domain-containing protein [Erysipelotrichaceae bacterium]